MTPEEARNELARRIRLALARGATPEGVTVAVLSDVPLLMQAIEAEKHTASAGHFYDDGTYHSTNDECWQTQWQEVTP